MEKLSQNKSKLEKVQGEFIKTLVHLQEKQIEAMRAASPSPMVPNFFNQSPRLPATARKKPTKKQLAALKEGRQVLSIKQKKETLGKK